MNLAEIKPFDMHSNFSPVLPQVVKKKIKITDLEYLVDILKEKALSKDLKSKNTKLFLQ